HLRVTHGERAVAAAARVVAAAEVGELPARGRGEDDLAGVPVRERSADPPRAVRIPELLERHVDAVAARDRLAVLEEERGLDRLVAVEPLREGARVVAV